MKGLKALESRIGQLIEEPFVRLFAEHLLPHEVAAHLVQALEDGEEIGPDGRRYVAGHYRVAVHPRDLAAIQTEHPQLAEELAVGLQALVRRMHIRLRHPPTVCLTADPTLPERGVRITPLEKSAAPTEERTRDLDLSRLEQQLKQEEAKLLAYLIISGSRTFDLAAETVTVGRALDNDLVIDDARVSRYHAQLRRRYGRYLLRDLDSTGGTEVNGFPVQETVLRPGDLITLSGVDMVYIEDGDGGNGGQRGGDTKPYQVEV